VNPGYLFDFVVDIVIGCVAICGAMGAGIGVMLIWLAITTPTKPSSR